MDQIERNDFLWAALNRIQNEEWWLNEYSESGRMKRGGIHPYIWAHRPRYQKMLDLLNDDGRHNWHITEAP